MQLQNTNDNLKSEEQLIPEGEYTFPEANDAIDDAIAQKNNELLELDPNEYLIGLLEDLNNTGEKLNDDEKKIAEIIITDTFGDNFSMKDLFEMDINKKTELLWNLTAIIRYIPTNPIDMPYTGITNGLRNGEKFGKLQMKLSGGTLRTATVEDLEKYFTKAQEFQIKNMLKLYRKTFPFGSTNIPTMHYAPLKGNINGNDSISENLSNVGREYYSYNLSDLDNDKENL